MLCKSCQNQSRCLPAQLAQKDSTLAIMLQQLKDCNVKIVPPRPAWLRALQEGWHLFWDHLKGWGRRLGLRVA